MADSYIDILRNAVLDEENFIKLTMRGKVRGPSVPWRQIVIRPVLVKQQRHLQFSLFDATQDTTKNYRGSEAQAKLEEIITIPFSSINLQTRTEHLHIQLTKKGKAILHHEAPIVELQQPQLEHNHAKAVPLPSGKPDRYLELLGIMNTEGQIRPHMQSKFTQINEFLKMLDTTGELEHFERTPINVLDCGCGSAYLTFAMYHYLNDIRGIPARLIGIDVNDHLIQKSTAIAADLGDNNLCFYPSKIVDYVPEQRPDIVLALHACDTATDEAISQGVLADARLILCTPCCHHELNDQIDADGLRPILRHGILKQRLGDIVTDAFRALVLRIMGYRTDVVEFISAEHTAKNIMIRAVKTASIGDQRFIREYAELKQFWHVTPALERLLGVRFTQLLG